MSVHGIGSAEDPAAPCWRRKIVEGIERWFGCIGGDLALNEHVARPSQGFDARRIGGNFKEIRVGGP